MTIKIDKEKLLMVEGKDEINFFNSLLISIDISDVQVMEVGGKFNFKNVFPGITKMSDFNSVKSYGIVRDADDNHDDTLCSIIDLLKKYKQPYPSTSGKIVDKNNKKVGIFIVPDNNQAGMLETLCLKSIEDLPENDCVESYFECLKNVDSIPSNMYKAKLQAYLASREKYCPSLGIGAQKKYFDFNNKIFSDLKLFLSNLFI